MFAIVEAMSSLLNLRIRRLPEEYPTFNDPTNMLQTELPTESGVVPHFTKEIYYNEKNRNQLKYSCKGYTNHSKNKTKQK